MIRATALSLALLAVACGKQEKNDHQNIPQQQPSLDATANSPEQCKEVGAADQTFVPGQSGESMTLDCKKAPADERIAHADE